MADGCIGNCLVCGKCAARGFSILDRFAPIRETSPREGFGIAVDLGTTTVVLALIDLTTGAVFSRHSFMNPQRKFGADVVSRIEAANNGSLHELRGLIASALADGVRVLTDACGERPLREMVIAGNTAMMYMLTGTPCDSLRTHPFRLSDAVADTCSYRRLLGDGVGGMDFPVRIVPCIGVFVGGDVTAGLLHVLTENAGRFLLVDLGTNGEMALWDRGNLCVTSTAAGPAFESGEAGGAAAALDSLAHVLRTGAMDKTGRLLGVERSPLTQKRIRDLQLAKSAVRAGAEILLENAGVMYGELDAVYLAGGIGQAMNAENAAAVGLFPSAERIRAVGNAALGGAARVLLRPDIFPSARELVSKVREVNLGSSPRFNELFMKYLDF